MIRPMEIRTARLLLRDFTLDDVGALNLIERQETVARYMTYDPQTPEQTREYIECRICEAQALPRRMFDVAIIRTADGELIGRCGLHVNRPEHREAMVWYLLRPDCWGQGLAREAVGALMGFGFESLGLHRVWADCDVRNEASCRLAERLGMKREGHLRENYWLKGEWCDTAIYGVLEQEWRAANSR